jgi:N-acetyl-alpha-D-glucosaminyl L-malate synthase BshA
MNLAITCFPTFGGSGIVATEIGLAMAARGHRVHFVCAELPWRLERFVDNVFFHEVQARDYPLFDQSPYALALTSKLVEVATWEPIDLLHVHYAIPHAASAYLARQILGPRAPRLITTLHGTDATVVGNDPSFLPVARFSVAQSDRVTVPSQALRRATYDNLGVPSTVAIDVIPNFVDTETYLPAPREAGRPFVIAHNSNFRPVKRVDDVVRVLAAVRRARPCQLVLIGDGPERSRIEREVHQHGLGDDVRFLGKQLNFVQVLQQADVFLLPSAEESFGLAALEAMACGVPVVASRVGGLPEVITEDCGFLLPLGDVDAMAAAVQRLADDPELHARMSTAARARAERFRKQPLIDVWEQYYRRLTPSREE